MSEPRGNVEIAGAGIAGLAAAAIFAARGWRVRVHERADEVRELGAGIYLKENSIRVLAALGLYGQLRDGGAVLRELHVRTEDGRTLRRDVGGERVVCVLRRDLHQALLAAALEAGTEILTSSLVVGASPAGFLLTEDGRRHEADLVIGADGVHSRVRESLGIASHVRTLDDGATRLLVHRAEPAPWSVESWHGRLRVGVSPCSPQDTYVYLIAPESDRRACATPVDAEYWSAAFPHLAGVFERTTTAPGVHHVHSLVTCDRWVAGRAAIVGDAAHAQPPNLGQGAGLAVSNAWGLADAVNPAGDIQHALLDWDRAFKPLTTAVQRWSCHYGRLALGWPPRLYGVRPAALRALAASKPVRTRWVHLWRGGAAGPDQTVRDDGHDQFTRECVPPYPAR